LKSFPFHEEKKEAQHKLVARIVLGPPRKLKSQCVSQYGPISTAEKERSEDHLSPPASQSPGNFPGRNPLSRIPGALGSPELTVR